jgi:hypothetical protein
MKKTKITLLTVFLLVIFLVPVLTAAQCLAQRSGWSDYENRALAKLPDFSASAAFSGKTQSGIESFLSDHLFQRDFWLQAYTALALDVRRSPTVNGVVITRTVLLPATGVADRQDDDIGEQAEKMAQSLAGIRKATEQAGGVFLYVGVPEQRSALRAYYPAYMNNNAAEWDENEAAFAAAMEQAGVPLLLMREKLSAGGDILQYYAKTDHHYNLRGAYLTYAAAMQALREKGVDAPTVQMDFAALPNPFYGTYSRKLYGLSPVADSLLSGVYADEPAYERWDNGKRTDAPMQTLPADAASPVFYGDYMQGDQGETIVQTNRTGLPKLLVVGDSFTDAFETIAWRSFSEMRSLDFRHYSENTLTQYIADYQPDAVIVLRDDASYLDFTGNGALQ